MTSQVSAIRTAPVRAREVAAWLGIAVCWTAPGIALSLARFAWWQLPWDLQTIIYSTVAVSGLTAFGVTFVVLSLVLLLGGVARIGRCTARRRGLWTLTWAAMVVLGCALELDLVRSFLGSHLPGAPYDFGALVTATGILAAGAVIAGVQIYAVPATSQPAEARPAP